MSRARSFRSVLFVPGTRQDRFASALASGADVVVFDLEDSVDASRKAAARELVREALTSILKSGVTRLVRVNAPDSPWWDDDLALISRLEGADGVVVPKAENPADLEQAAQAAGTRVVVPLLETARGILRADALAGARAAIPAVLFGAEDLSAQLGIPRTVDGEELLYARSRVVLAAAAAGVEAVDAVFVDLAATDALRRDALRARALGFRGKMAIHPAQIPIIHEVFSPTPEELARAQRIVEAYDAARARGEGVIRLDNQMVDEPVVSRARKILSWRT